MTSTNALWGSACIVYMWREAGKCRPARQESSWNESLIVAEEEVRPSISGWRLLYLRGDFESTLWPDSVFTSFCTTYYILTLVPSLKLSMSGNTFTSYSLQRVGEWIFEILYLQTKWWLLTHPQETFKYVFFLLQHTRPDLVFLAWFVSRKVQEGEKKKEQR